MLLSSPSASEVVESGPDSISHSTTSQHFVSFGLIVVVLLWTVFDLIFLRRLGNEIHLVLFIAMSSIASVVIAAS